MNRIQSDPELNRIEKDLLLRKFTEDPSDLDVFHDGISILLNDNYYHQQVLIHDI